MSFIRGICRSKTPLPASSLLLHELLRIPTTVNKDSSPSSSSCPPPSHSPPQFPNSLSFASGISFCYYHDGRPRGPLWRGKKMIGKEALFVISGLKRYKDDEEKLENFIKTHVSRLLKMDMIAVLVELERQDEVTLALKSSNRVYILWQLASTELLGGHVHRIFRVIQKEDWYKPDKFLYKDLIMALAKCKKMEEAMQLWETMRKEDLFPDCQTYTEVIRGFLRIGSPADAMNIYEDMKQSPDPPEELPFRILLKGLLPHPLLRNRVKQDFEEIFPDSSAYDPPEEILGYAKVIGNNKHWGNCTLHRLPSNQLVPSMLFMTTTLGFVLLASLGLLVEESDIITKFSTKLLSVLWKS